LLRLVFDTAALRNRRNSQTPKLLNSQTPMSSPILIIEDDDFQYEIYEEALSKYKL